MQDCARMLLRLGQWWFSFLLCFEIVKVIIVTITTTRIKHVSCLEIEDQSRVGQWKTLIMQLPRIYQIVGSESALQLRFIEIANTAKQLQKCFSIKWDAMLSTEKLISETVFRFSCIWKIPNNCFSEFDASSPQQFWFSSKQTRTQLLVPVSCWPNQLDLESKWLLLRTA